MTEATRLEIARDVKNTATMREVIAKYFPRFMKGEFSSEVYKGILKYWEKTHLTQPVETTDPKDEVVNTEEYAQTHIVVNIPEKFKEGSRERILLDFLADGQKHHASELNKVVGWDWTTPLSRLYRTPGINIKKFPAGKHKEYQLIVQK